MSDPVDISKLTDEELSVYQDLLAGKEMKNPRNAPGPAPVPKLNGMGANWLYKPSAGDISVNTDITDPNVQALQQAVSKMPGPAGVAADHRLPDSKDFSSLLPGPGWLRFLNMATTNGPADLATAATLHGAGALGDMLKAATPVKNAVLGAVKGAGQFELGTRLHAALSGQDQPPVDPRDRSGTELTYQALSGALGGAAGYKAAPTPVNPNEVQKNLFSAYQQKRSSLENALADLKVSAVDAEANHDSASNSLSDATQRLRDHERMMEAKAATATGAEKKAFQAQAAYLRQQEQQLRFNLQDAQDAHKNALDAVKEQQGKLTGVAKFNANISSNSTSDQILALENHLDELRNPDTGHTFSAPTQDEIDLQKRIEDLTSRRDSGKWTGKNLDNINETLKDKQEALDDARNSRVQGQVDSVRAQIRELKDQRRRVEAGRTLETDPNDAVALQNELNHRQSGVDISKAALEEINNRYRQASLTRLGHASTAPGATVGDLGDVHHDQDLMKAVDEATTAKRDAFAGKRTNQKQQAELNAELTKLKNSAPPAPKDNWLGNNSQILKSVLKTSLPALGLGAGEHASGSWLSLGPWVGMASGMAVNGLANTDAGRKLLQFLESHVGPNTPKVIPALVNQSSQPR